jgi:SMODS and SLOG-associating 2TM effector domain 3
MNENVSDGDRGADGLELPAILLSADKSSTRAQKWFLVLTATSLALVAAAASMGAVDQSWAGWVGAGAFLGAFVLGSLAITQNLERIWYDGRAAAESAKALAWLYAFRGGPYGDDTYRAEESYERRLRSVRKELMALDFALPLAGAEMTPSMRALREAPLAVRREHYKQHRILDRGVPGAAFGARRADTVIASIWTRGRDSLTGPTRSPSTDIQGQSRGR